MPDWAEPVVRYILEVGLPATLRVSAISVVGATVVSPSRYRRVSSAWSASMRSNN